MDETNIPLGVNQILGSGLANPATGDLKHDIAKYRDELSQILDQTPALGFQELPKSMPISQAINHLTRQYSNTGPLRSFLSYRMFTHNEVQAYIQQDLLNRLIDLRVKVHFELSRLKLKDWDKIERAHGRVLELQDGLTQMKSR